MVDSPASIYAFNTLRRNVYPAIDRRYDHGTVMYELDLQALDHYTRERSMFQQFTTAPWKLSFPSKKEKYVWQRKHDLQCVECYDTFRQVKAHVAVKCGFKLDKASGNILYDIFRDGNWQRVEDIFAYAANGWRKAEFSSNEPVPKTRRLCYNEKCIHRHHLYTANDNEYKKRQECPAFSDCKCEEPKCIIPGDVLYRDGWLSVRKIANGM
jgi:hypothetical protein